VDIKPLLGLGGVLIAAMVSEFNDQVTSIALVDVRGALGIGHDRRAGSPPLAALAELAQSYMQLRGTQNRLQIARRNLRLSEQNVDLVTTRFGNGVATTLDLAQARGQQATIAATLPPLRTREAELINAVGLLLGYAPRALESELRKPAAIPRVPRRVPVGLPGTLVRRRPDVREAEARLHEATAQTGVAVANFYPDVTLNGAASAESLQ
jgi:outer membrane protein TolC